MEKLLKSVKKVGVPVLVLMLMLVSVLSFSACGEKKDASQTKEKVKIGIAQIVDHPSLNEIRENIIKQLEKEGYIDGETATITYEDAQNEQSNLKTICQKFTAEKYDIIIPIATPTAQTALGETSEIPIVFSAVTDPVGAELVAKIDEPSGTNITGVSDAVSAKKIMDTALKITPDIKKIGALYTSSEVNSQSVVKELKEYAKEKNIEVVDGAVTASSEIQQMTNNLASKCDAVFSPIDNTVAAGIAIVTKTLNEKKIPYYVGADSMVADGGLATDGVDYSELGIETGKIAARVLKGENPGDIPVLTMSDTKVYYNSKTAKAIGITIPEDIITNGADLGKTE